LSHFRLRKLQHLLANMFIFHYYYYYYYYYYYILFICLYFLNFSIPCINSILAVWFFDFLLIYCAFLFCLNCVGLAEFCSFFYETFGLP
jgi:hypothetical protein